MRARSKVFSAAVFLFLAGIVQAAPINVLIGNATANDTQAGANDKFAELLTKYSDGRIKASVRHGGSLGTNTQMLAALQAGSIQGMDLPAGFLSPVVPELSLFDLPFLLPGAPAKITAFYAQSKAAVQMMQLAEIKGIHIIGFHGVGPQNFPTRFPVHKLSDIEGKKFRVIPSPIRVGTYQDWGAVARPMAFSEVYSALQQGTVDGIETPPDIGYKLKMYEVAKYYTIAEASGFVPSALVFSLIVSKKWFDGLPKDLQAVVARAGKETIVWADVAFTKAQNDSLNALRKLITVTEMPAGESLKMKALTRTGIWQRTEKDPKKGPLVKLLEMDIANYEKHSK